MTRTIASLCLAFELMLGALPLSGVILCVAPGSHVALEFSSADCEATDLPASPTLTPECTDYRLSQSEAVPADLRLPVSNHRTVGMIIDARVRIAATSRISLRVESGSAAWRAPDLHSLRTIILLV